MRYKIILSVILASILFSCNESPNTTEINQSKIQQTPETQRMIKRLHAISKNTNPMSTSFMNNERLLILEDITSQELIVDNIPALTQLAKENLHAGNSIKAASQYETILDFVKSHTEEYSQNVINQIRTSLVVAYLRMGEQANCVMLHVQKSCLFPLNPSAVHLNQKGSRNALKHLQILLEQSPNDVSLLWLYNIAAQTVGEVPKLILKKWLIPMDLFASDIEMPAFKNKALSTQSAIIDIAGGSVTEDFNNDGYIDIMASAWGTNSQIKLLINDGNGGFNDETIKAGLYGLIGGLNLISADYDNDGDVDVLVLRGAWRMENGKIPNSLLMNDGTGKFSDVTESANILSFHPTQTAAWGDIDNDGWLDLYIGNESFTGNTHPAELYHNNQDGTFTEIAKQIGLDSHGYIKGSVWGDYNNDGLIDLYVSRMDRANQLFKNQSFGNKIKFVETTIEAGVEEPIYSFPVWFWDYDNDGWLDIFVADYDLKAYISKTSNNSQLIPIINNYMDKGKAQTSSRLYHNNGDGTFSDTTNEMRLNEPLLAMGANFGDIDNDGYLDMYIGTGDPDFKTLIPNRLFRNNKNYFQDVTTTNEVGHLQKGHAISFADLDNDGDQDIYAIMGGAYSGDFFQNALFENPGHGNNWITIKLVGTESNRSAIGARVRINIVENKQISEIHRVVNTGGSFGANSLQLEIGLNKSNLIKSITIQWPSGTVSEFSDVAVNQIIKITEDNQDFEVINTQPFEFH